MWDHFKTKLASFPRKTSIEKHLSLLAQRNAIITVLVPLLFFYKSKVQSWAKHLLDFYNFFHVLRQFLFTTNKRKLDNYHQKVNVRVASQVFELFKTQDLSKSSHPELFCQKGVLKNFSRFTEKHLCQRDSFLTKFQALVCNFI